MATAAEPLTTIARERRFFLYMAIAYTATVVIGFSVSYLFLLNKRAIDLPIPVHIHAMTFATWTGLYLLQNVLVDRGHVAIHRTLGLLGAGWAAWMWFVGVGITVFAIQSHTVPFFFAPPFFLAMNSLGITAFVALVASAIVLRRRADWHKRLMLGAQTVVIAPALGRLVPMPLLGFWGDATICAVQMVYLGVAMRQDLRVRGAVHPAYWWGIAALVGTTVLAYAIGYSAPMVALADKISAW